MIRDELLRYGHELDQRPEIVAVTKADLPSAAAVCRELAEAIGRDVLLISAVTGQGLNTLVQTVARTLEVRS